MLVETDIKPSIVTSSMPCALILAISDNVIQDLQNRNYLSVTSSSVICHTHTDR